MQLHLRMLCDSQHPHARHQRASLPASHTPHAYPLPPSLPAASQPHPSQHGARGYDKVEEYDPIERMKRLATGPAVDSMPSLEDELRTIHAKVDINKFDYKPVPRTADDNDEQ